MSFHYGVTQERDWNALSDTEFRQILRAEFEAHYPAELRYAPRRLRWHENKDWYLRMAEKGWIAPNWPVEYGGMGLSAAKLLIFQEEVERWGIGRYQDHGTLMLGPVLLRWGTEEQRRQYLPDVLACKAIWCQGYSEPGSGSDLASLKTKAVREGDEFVITGQKIWTTLAQDATHMFVLVRTDFEAKKQEGISFLLVDLAQKGVTVRPIRDMAGHEEFCEVFLDEVRTPVSNLVGELNKGWTVAKSLLGFERIHVGSPKMPEYGLTVLEKLARARGLWADPVFREKYGALKLDVAHLSDAYNHFTGIVVRGEALGQDISWLKVWATETFQRIADLVVDTAGPFAAINGELEIAGTRIDVLASFYKARPPTIYGGSNEIQRNILAQQVLGLPRK
ncbi:MAG: acyl-CoA dehydrogenase family protein [Alphaproteobacteria bacterium]|nr:acyl-CoA dehydrogenase family protein [Alphaproteobacteria bacterium]MBU0797183.1 acyl-CoA dehydrogenase family protein [Alphaproteobacteria bacterium]MBU0887146.1 acyl-CoA dehydrogenase family protein [Alphaproteobacteria bacterium]MBU1814396.1 acyl-CoA dehydrogenase family protein [Alphaproteobacteria bacterium]